MLDQSIYGAADRLRAGLQIGTDLRDLDEIALILLRGQGGAENLTPGPGTIRFADSGRRADGKDKGDDYDGQEDKKKDLVVFLEAGLQPGYHGTIG